MNCEYMSVVGNKVSISNEKGEHELRDSTNNLVEILENENLKEKIENELSSFRTHKNNIEKDMKEFKKNNNIENIISLLFVVLFFIASIKFNLFAIMISEIGNVSFWLLGGMLTWGGIVSSKIKRDIKSEIERKNLVCIASIALLEHLLEKTNANLKKLKETDKSSIEFSYDRTKVSTAKVDDLNIKLNLVNRLKNDPDDIMINSNEIYDLRNREKKVSIGEEEQEIISYCQNACRITNMKRVLQRTMR